MNRNTIRERLRFATLSPGTSPSNFFTNDIPEKTMRYIVAILIIGDNVGTKTVTVSRVNEDDTLTTFLNAVPVGATELKPIPPSYDVENPILTLEGGTNLAASASASGPKVTVIYWDDEI
jgi:hypothetical protein